MGSSAPPESWARGHLPAPPCSFPGAAVLGSLLPEKKGTSPGGALFAGVLHTAGEGQSARWAVALEMLAPRQGLPHTVPGDPALLKASQLVPVLSTALLAPLATEGKALSPPQFIFSQSCGEVTMVNWGGSCPRTDGHWDFPAQWAGERLGGYRLTQDINLQKILSGKG